MEKILAHAAQHQDKKDIETCVSMHSYIMCEWEPQIILSWIRGNLAFLHRAIGNLKGLHIFVETSKMLTALSSGNINLLFCEGK